MSFSKCDLQQFKRIAQSKKSGKKALGGIEASKLLEQITKGVIKLQMASAKTLEEIEKAT